MRSSWPPAWPQRWAWPSWACAPTSIALAPGRRLNAYFAFAVVKGMGFTWQMALGAVFISGCLSILISLLRLREAIVNAIPRSLKFAISAGIGLKNAGLFAAHPATFG